MSDDLVDRLRLRHTDTWPMQIGKGDLINTDGPAAADRIEELEKRVEQAKIVFATMRSEMVNVCAVMKAFEDE